MSPRPLATVLPLILAAQLLGAGMAPGQEPADLVLTGGRIYTLDAAMPWARAVAIRGNRILAVFPDEPSADLIGPETRVLELGGRFVAPGFVDAHVHLEDFAARLRSLDLMPVSNDDALVERVAAFVAELEQGEWVTGGFWDGDRLLAMGAERIEQYRAERWLPDRYTIDPVSEANPVLLESFDGDLFLANTTALRAAGLEWEPEEGMDVDEFGDPTGIIHRGSPAVVRLMRVTTPKSEQRILDEVRTAFRHLAGLGITEIHDMTSDPQVLRYLQLEAAEELSARVWMRPHLLMVEHVVARGARMGHHPLTGSPDRFLRWGALKGHLDGELRDHGALLFEPYADRRTSRGRYRQCSSSHALLREPDSDKLDGLLNAAVEAGFVTNVHAVGPRAVAEVLAAFGRLQETRGEPLRGHRVVHAEIVRPDDLPRFGAVNAIAEVNPGLIASDMALLHDRLGAERAEWSFPLRDLLANDVELVFGSGAGNDLDPEHVRPDFLLHAAVNRSRADGTPSGGWLPEQRIPIAEALRAYTLGGARAALDGDLRGWIAPGMLADLVVLDRNLLETGPERILGTNVLLTMVDGRIVHRDDVLR